MISEFQSVSPTIAQNGSTSSSFCVGEFNHGALQMPSALTSTSFWTEVSLDNQNFTRLQDSAGANVAEQPCSAAESCPLPSGVFNYKFARIVVNAGEAAARTLAVFLKG